MIISSEEKATSVLSSRIQAFNLEGKDISSKRRSYILFCGNIAGFDLVGFFFFPHKCDPRLAKDFI